MPDEKLLVQQAQAGDSAAFEALVTAYEGKIYNLALRYLGNREDAKDASQEVFLRVFRFLPGFQQDSGFSTWIYRIGVNVCKDILRKRTRQKEQPLEYSDEEEDSRPMEIPDERHDPEKLYSEKELRRILGDAIADLPEPQREIVILRDVQGLSYDEISDTLALESGTVKSRISRARKNLQKKLLQNGNIFDITLSNLSKGGKTDESL